MQGYCPIDTPWPKGMIFMANWFIILITAAVLIGIMLLTIFAWTHRAGRLARGVAGDRYNRFVGMGGATSIPPPGPSEPNPPGTAH